MKQEEKRQKQIDFYLKKYKNVKKNPNWLTILGWVYNKYWVLLDFDMLEFRKNWKVLQYIFLNKKQREAFRAFQDDEDPSEEILYWGWAWWWKSFLLGLIVFLNSIMLIWSSWFVWRRVLKDVRTSTIADFEKLMLNCWFEDFLHNRQDWIIKFNNWSIVRYWELENLPSDETFKRLWSFQYTGIFIDEAQEVVYWAKSALRFRLRQNKKIKVLEDWKEKIIWKKRGKMYFSCNPWTNWLFTDFFIPWEKWILKQDKKFIQALPEDNDFLDDEVLNLYRNTDNKLYKEIYYYWNWHYNDDPNILFSYDDLVQSFIQNTKDIWDKEMYMSVDISWLGKDKTIITVWQGLTVIYIEKEDITNQKKLKSRLEELEKQYWIKRKNVIIDSTWIGDWFTDFYEWAVKFKWWAKSLEKLEEEVRKKEGIDKDLTKDKYYNDRSAVFFKLSWAIKNNYIYFKDQRYKEDIINELSFIKEKIGTNSLDKLERRVISKDEIKKLLGKSPDFADSISMRMYFMFNIKEKEDNRTIEDFNIFF